MKKNIVRFILLVVTIAATTACVRDDFRYYGYEDELEGYFPVDSIEKNHPWTLTNVCSSYVTGYALGATKVQILSGNPFTEQDVEILAEASAESRVSRQMTYALPQAQKNICAVALDKDGNYLLLANATPNQETITLSDVNYTDAPNATSLQRFFYCFEADYPNPGDWDYNDIVLSVTKEVTPDNPNVLALHVTLHAVGYLTQIAAAIRLVGYKNVTITQDTTTTFVREPETERTLIKESDVQLTALNGDPVINLFDDAHLAMFHRSTSGSIFRRYFNTVRNPSSSAGANSSPRPAITVTYYIDFGNEHQARHFTLTELDPFLVVQYGQTGDNFWEIHTHPYKLHEVLYQYYNGAAYTYNNGFSWALAIPYGKFRYPTEEIPIGMRKNSIVWGAYQTSGHAFGEWILDHTVANDWFLYPTEAGVY